MSDDAKFKPHMLDPLGTTGDTVADGLYGFAVTDGKVSGMAAAGLPLGGAEGETVAKASASDGDYAVITGSMVTVVLPAGSTAADMATLAPNAPVPCIVRIRA